jgi:hypothetical protein
VFGQRGQSLEEQSRSSETEGGRMVKGPAREVTWNVWAPLSRVYQAVVPGTLEVPGGPPPQRPATGGAVHLVIFTLGRPITAAG